MHIEIGVKIGQYTFCFLTKEAMFSWKKIRDISQSNQNSRKRREMWFLAGVCVYAGCMCVCVRMCARFSTFQDTSWMACDIYLKFGTPMK